MNEQQSQDWLDQLAGEVNAQYPTGELIISSGHSPSGTYHIGTLREIMTANAITWALRRMGRAARHVDFVDDFDAFRKVPKFVPEEWSRYLGQPVSAVPDPFSCHETYGAHFIAQLHEGLTALGAMPDETIYGHDTYPKGVFTDEIVTVLDKLDEVRQILTEVGGRQLDATWAPVESLDVQGNLRTRKFAGWDSARREVAWRTLDGDTGVVAADSGLVKLSWRLDWPARWTKWGVAVEPFGRDHATKGGSYETGKVLAEKIFGGRAPYPVPYEFINTVGETKKMSKSTGNVLTPGDALAVMPPEILRYFVIGPRPGRTLNFDSGLGLYALIDEYVKARESGARTGALEYARAGLAEETISRVPFNHLVTVRQTGRDDTEIKDILERTGYEQEVREQWPVIKHELMYVANWLAKYAPERVKFVVQRDALPEVALSQQQRAFLGALAEVLEARRSDFDGEMVEELVAGQEMHNLIYEAKDQVGLSPAEAFEAIYKVILGREKGPKAGYFLAGLDEVDREWLLGRLREGSAALESSENLRPSSEAALPDGRAFCIDQAVREAFPAAVVGYVVADVVVRAEGPNWSADTQASLEVRNLSKDDLATTPELRDWREVYRKFGVKPSDYRCSVEALVRRALDGKPAQVNSVVDAYNYISVKHLLPMGAMDLDHVSGDIELRFGRAGETAELLGIEKPVTVTDKQVVYADEKRIVTWLWNYRDARDTAVTLETKRAIFFVDGLHGQEKVMAAVRDLVNTLEGPLGCKVLAQGCLPDA